MSIQKNIWLGLLLISTIIIIVILVFENLHHEDKEPNPGPQRARPTDHTDPNPALPFSKRWIFEKPTTYQHRMPDDIPGILAEDRILALGDCYVREGGNFYWNIDYDVAVLKCMQAYGRTVDKTGHRPEPPVNWDPPSHPPVDYTKNKEKKKQGGLEKRKADPVPWWPDMKIVQTTLDQIKRIDEMYADMKKKKLANYDKLEAKLMDPNPPPLHDWTIDIATHIEELKQAQAALKMAGDKFRKTEDMRFKEEWQLARGRVNDTLVDIGRALDGYLADHPVEVGAVRQKLRDYDWEHLSRENPQRPAGTKRNIPHPPPAIKIGKPDDVMKGGRPRPLPTGRAPWLNEVDVVMSTVQNGMSTPDGGLHVMAHSPEDYDVARYMIDQLGVTWDYAMEMLAWWGYRDYETQQLLDHGYPPYWGEAGLYDEKPFYKSPEDLIKYQDNCARQFDCDQVLEDPPKKHPDDQD